jgi:predicted acyl esterase
MPETPLAETFDCRSFYVPMRDGVRLAVSVLMPPGFAGKRPALAVFTRYGRATRAGILAIPFSESLAFMREGFVVVSVDVRGTGASFGCRLVEKWRSPGPTAAS